MKAIIAFLFTAFFFYNTSAFAQEQTQSQPAQTQDGVQGWYPQNSGFSQSIRGVFFKNKDTGYATIAGTAALTAYSTNGGMNWQVFPDSVSVIRFIGTFGYGYNKDGTGSVSTSIDNGITWSAYDLGFGGGNFYFTTPNDGFCNVQNFIGRTLDGGKTWKLDTTYVGVDIHAFASFDSLRIMAVGADYYVPANHGHNAAGIFLTTNGGDSWHYASSIYFNDIAFNNIAFLDSTSIIIIADTKNIFRSSNLSYSVQPCNLGDSSGTLLEGVSAPNKNNIIIVGEGGKIFRSNDGGLTWQKQNSGTTANLYAVNFIDSSNGWAVGDNGIILNTINAGYSWVNPPAVDSLSLTANPNPTNSVVNINYFMPQDQHVTIIVYDIQGNVIDSVLTNVFQSQGQQSISIDIHSLASGTYIIRFQSEQYQSVINCSVVH